MVVGFVVDVVHHPLHTIPDICAGAGGFMQVLWRHVQLMPFAHAGMIAGLVASLALHSAWHGKDVAACMSKAGVKCLGMGAVIAVCLRVFETASPQSMMAAMAVGFVSMDLGKAMLPDQASRPSTRRGYGTMNGRNTVIP